MHRSMARIAIPVGRSAHRLDAQARQHGCHALERLGVLHTDNVLKAGSRPITVQEALNVAQRVVLRLALRVARLRHDDRHRIAHAKLIGRSPLPSMVPVVMAEPGVLRGCDDLAIRGYETQAWQAPFDDPRDLRTVVAPARMRRAVFVKGQNVIADPEALDRLPAPVSPQYGGLR